MRTLIGTTRLPVITLALMLAATTASAQIGVGVNANASAQVGKTQAGTNAPVTASSSPRNEARMNGIINSQLHATTTAKMHANENSALNATITASSSSASQGEPRKVPARFLGIFKTQITAHITVDANGVTHISYPWWAFLFGAKATTTVSAQ